MTDLHWTFVAVAYGATAIAIVAEIVALRRRRGQALARVERERDLDEDVRGD